MQDDSPQFVQTTPYQRNWCRRHPRAAVLSVIVIAIVAFVIISGVRYAQQQRELAEERGKVLHATQVRFAESNRLKGLELIDRGDSDWGLLWLAEALQELPEGEGEFRTQIRDEIAGALHTRRPLIRERKVQTPVTGFYESHDGKQAFIVSGAVGQVYDIAGMPVGKPIRHGTAINAAAFSPDGKKIAIGGTAAEGEVEFVARYSIDTGEQSGLRFETGSHRSIQALAWHGDHIAAGVAGHLYVWNTKADKTAFAPKQLSGQFAAIAFDGWKIVVLQTGTPAKLLTFDIEKGDPVGTAIELSGISPGVSTPSSLRIIDGKYRTVSGGQQRVWNSADGKLLDVLHLPGPDSYVSRSNIITDGPAMRFVALPGGQLTENSLHHKTPIVGAMSDGHGVLSVSIDGTIRAWGELGHVVMKLESSVRGLSVSPDGKHLVVYDDRGRAVLKELLKQSNQKLPGVVHLANWLPDSQHVLIASERNLHQWNIDSRWDGIENLLDTALQIQMIDGKYFVASQNRVYWFHLKDNPVIRKLIEVNGVILGVNYAQKQQQLEIVTRVGDDVFIQLHPWDKSEPLLRQKLPGVKLAEFGKVLFAPDESWVAIPGVGEVSFWFRDTSKFWSYPLDPGDRITTMITNPTADILYVGSASGKLYAVEIATDKFIWKGRAHREAVTAMVLSPGGSRLISAGADGVVQQWDIKTGEPVGPRYPHPKGVTTLALLPNRRIVTGCQDGTVRIWSTDPELPSVNDLREHLQIITGLKLQVK